MITVTLQTEADTLSLGKALASQAQMGDVITLSGPLGAGKTVLARGFLTSLLGPSVEVASPTFTLVNVYDSIDPPVWHFDLYRLESPDEIEELGLEEALSTGISLIEWPERAEGRLPENRVHVTLSVDDQSQKRTAMISANATWHSRLKDVQALVDAT